MCSGLSPRSSPAPWRQGYPNDYPDATCTMVDVAAMTCPLLSVAVSSTG
jgi:hypothetical protein